MSGPAAATLTFEDDEGPLSQGWDAYIILDLVLELLRQPATGANPAWSELIRYALEQRSGCDATAFCSDAVEQLLAEPWIRKHRTFKRLKALEAATR